MPRNTLFRTLMAAVVTVALAACGDDFFNPTLTLDPPPFDKMLVVFAEGRAGEEYITLTVGENFGVLDNKRTPTLGQPIISLEINGVAQGTVTFENDHYTITLPQPLAPGQVCRLSVAHAGFPTVTSTQTVPEIVPLTDIAFFENGGVNEYGEPSSRVQVRLNDPVGPNFYAAALLWVYDLYEWESAPRSNEPGAVTSSDGYRVLLTDQAFEGKQKELSFLTFRQEDDDLEIFIKWRSISGDYYRYTATEELFWETTDNPFATPVEIHSGMENGLGIFNLYNEVSYRVR